VKAVSRWSRLVARAREAIPRFEASLRHAAVGGALWLALMLILLGLLAASPH